MSVARLEHVTKIGVEQMGDLADSLKYSHVLRLENLDTDLRPARSALDFTRQAVDDDDANSYLPFLGRDVMRQAACALVGRQSGRVYDWKTEYLISAGGLSGILNVLLATLEPGDEVLMTNPIYVGLINRVRLAGGVPRYVPLLPSAQGWRLDEETLKSIDPRPVRAALLMSSSMPTGAVFSRDEWQTLVDFCERADCWLINDTATERILFDGRPVILERAVGRPLGCVPRGVWQGTTRRNSCSIATSCNAARRRAGRAPWAVATFTLRVSMPMAGNYYKINVLRSFPGGQLLFLGLFIQPHSRECVIVSSRLDRPPRNIG